MIIQYRKCIGHVCMCALKRVILFDKSPLSHLLQEPSCYVIPELRYEDGYKLCLIIVTVHYVLPVTSEDSDWYGITFNVHIRQAFRHLMSH